MSLTSEDSSDDVRKLVEKCGFRVVYVPHEVIKDYNATYNVVYKNELITTRASKRIGVPLNEIWISEMWRPYERCILFHELKEIQYKAKGFSPREAHRRAARVPRRWKNDPAFQKMIREIREMDRKTQAKRKTVRQMKKQRLQLNTVIIRLGGEIGTKAAWTRKLYERHLNKNIKAALKHHAIPYEAITRRFGRLYLKTSMAQSASQKLAKVFGISSLSPALQTTSELDDIVKKSIVLARQRLREGNSFAVRCRRVGRHAYTSAEVCREIGRQILGSFPNLRLRVNLKHPDVTIGIEIRENEAFVFADVIEGVRGLPLGTQPKVICLLNEEVNSSVACWLVMKRGCPIVPLYFDNTPFSDDEATELTLKAARTLFNWALGFSRKIHVVPNGQNLGEIQRKCPEELTQVVSKRLMYRIAERIAETKGAEGIVSGESLGEPPDQTLRKIRLFDEAVKLYPIHRPVLGLTEAEVKQLARKIGTSETTIKKTRKRLRVARKVAVTTTVEKVKAVENKLNTEKMVETSTKSLRIVSL